MEDRISIEFSQYFDLGYCRELMVEIARDFLIPDEAESLSQYYGFSYLESLIYHENVDRVSIQKKRGKSSKGSRFSLLQPLELGAF